jgi:hypothetical protein
MLISSLLRIGEQGGWTNFDWEIIIAFIIYEIKCGKAGFFSFPFSVFGGFDPIGKHKGNSR